MKPVLKTLLTRNLLHGKDVERGFTLLETLVALTILSLSVPVLFGVFSTGIERARDDRLAMQSRVLAQNLLVQASSQRWESAQRTARIEQWCEFQPFVTQLPPCASPRLLLPLFGRMRTELILQSRNR